VRELLKATVVPEGAVGVPKLSGVNCQDAVRRRRENGFRLGRKATTS